MSNHTASGGLGSWFSTFDHKKIAWMFLGWTMGLFLVAGIMAGYFKMMAFYGKGLDQVTLDSLLTYHGVAMAFMFAVPLIPSVLGFFLLPLQIGAKEMAFPTLSRYSLRFYVISVVLMLISLARQPVATGWTFITPFSMTGGTFFLMLALSLFFQGASWTLTGLNFITTVHHKRSEEMGFFDMPVLSWSLYLVSYVLVIAGLLLAITIMYLAGAAATGRGLFSAESNPLDWQNYFWFITNAAAFFAIIPAMGVITDVISGISGKAVVGYRVVVGSLIAMLALSLVTWGVHMSGMGQDPALSFTFAAFSVLVVVPVALVVYSWLATLYRGAVHCAAPTTFVVAFLFNAGIGGMLGLFLTNMSVGSYLGTTLFKSAQMYYLLMGGILGATLSGLHYWWPKFSGRSYSDGLARMAAGLYAIGLNLTFFPLIIMGAKGMEQGAHGLPASVDGLQNVSHIGMGVLLLGVSMIVFNLVSSLTEGKKAAQDPWGAGTLEWKSED